MVKTNWLCNRHLLGEHGEIHKHRHNFVKGHSITGRIGQIEPISMACRHDALAEEMLRRKMNHKSPYVQPDLSNYNLDGFTVDLAKSTADLAERCVKCAERIRSGLAGF